MAGVGGQDERLRVLVVDDEPNVVDAVSAALREQGFDVQAADTGAAAVAKVREWRPHALVLDVMLPDVDGFELARRLAQEGVGVPILFLGARDAAAEAVQGSTTGDENHLMKPFRPEELLARLHSVLRRGESLQHRSTRLAFADLELDEATCEVSRGGEPIELTATEYRLLRFLMQNPRRVLTRQQLLNHVWNYDFSGDARILETYMSYLRKKLDVGRVPLLHTVRGVGYSLRLPKA
jgi:two-component system OmpR family response regulator